MLKKGLFMMHEQDRRQQRRRSMFLSFVLLLSIMISICNDACWAHRIGTRRRRDGRVQRRGLLQQQQKERPIRISYKQTMDSLFPCDDKSNKAGGASKECDKVLLTSNPSAPEPTRSPSSKPTPEPTTRQPTSRPTPEPTTQAPTSRPTPQPTLTSTTLIPTSLPELQIDNSNNNYALGACTGHCEDDGDCFDDLKCFVIQSGNDSSSAILSAMRTQEFIEEVLIAKVPGCSGIISLKDDNTSPVNYCYNPVWNATDTLINVGNNGRPARSFPLGLCQGDCDADTDCKEGLKCFQREGLEAIPGCPKGGGLNNNDYCYDPAATSPPSPTPVLVSTDAPQIKPTPKPSNKPINAPQQNQPIQSPSNDNNGGNEDITYQPGNFSLSYRSPDGLIRLSNGLVAELLAVSGEFVQFADGSFSNQEFHIAPDGAAVFDSGKFYDDGEEGWYYVSNAENETVGRKWTNGGVGALEFNGAGQVIGYKRIANNLRMNCGGGRTPWNSWITCEEIEGGKVHQIDPAGIHPSNRTEMGTLGTYESFAYDLESNGETPTFYVTRDAHNGAITRFTPNSRGMDCFKKIKDEDRWCTLNYGSRDYLLLGEGTNVTHAHRTVVTTGKFTWTTNLREAKKNAEIYYPHPEGIDSYQGYVYVTSKRLKRLVILNLRDQTYSFESTENGAFDEQPDQVARILRPDHSNEESEHKVATNQDFISTKNDILYFCEDGGRRTGGPGIFGRTMEGRYFSVVNADKFPYASETTGLAYSPTGHDMYVSFQEAGRIYRFYREDGYPFQGAMLDIKYHAE